MTKEQFNSLLSFVRKLEASNKSLREASDRLLKVNPPIALELKNILKSYTESTSHIKNVVLSDTDNTN